MTINVFLHPKIILLLLLFSYFLKKNFIFLLFFLLFSSSFSCQMSQSQPSQLFTNFRALPIIFICQQFDVNATSGHNFVPNFSSMLSEVTDLSATLHQLQQYLHGSHATGHALNNTINPVLNRVTEKHKPIDAIRLVLAHPEVNVDARDGSQYTLLGWACADGLHDAARVLLATTKATLLSCVHPSRGETLLKVMCECSNTEMVRLVIAFRGDSPEFESMLHHKEKYLGSDNNYVMGTPVQFLENKRKYTWYDRNFREVHVLLTDYMTNPAATRLRVRRTMSADLFALIVFICDDFLRIRNPVAATDTTVTEDDKIIEALTGTPARRFYHMVAQLPMEIQMRITNMTYNCMSSNIPTCLTEPAFKKLARILLQTEPHANKE